MSNIIYEEKSKLSWTAGGSTFVFIALILLWISYSIYMSITKHTVLIIDFTIQGCILFVLVKQALCKYRYTLTDTALEVEEKGLLGRRTWIFPYEDINGVCYYSREFFDKFNIRYRLRLASSMDNRPTQQLVYSVYKGKNVKHGRAILKAEPAFYEALEKKIPGLVCIPKDDVVMNTLIREEAHRLGRSFAEYRIEFNKNQ